MTEVAQPSPPWQTKPTDRFVLKWIKLNLSARITPRLIGVRWLKPSMITVCSTALGVWAGIMFALGWGLVAGLLAAASQIMDGVDGQFARLTGQQSAAGAFLDSVMDRYSDGSLVFGLTIYCLWLDFPAWVIAVLGAVALMGSGLISYTSARAENVGINLGGPTLASKGTRTSTVAVSGILSPWSSLIPLLALVYLAVHSNTVVLYRIGRAFRVVPAEDGES